MKPIIILSVFIFGAAGEFNPIATKSSFANSQSLDPMQICQNDIQKHCANVQPGEGRLAQCIRENRSKLSSQCRKIVTKKQSQRKERKIACEQDIAKLCSGVQPGGKRVTDCLRQQKEKLSSGCKQVKQW